MSLNDYVDKKTSSGRWVGGPKKKPILVHVKSKKNLLKNVDVEVGRWSKKGKIVST